MLATEKEPGRFVLLSEEEDQVGSVVCNSLGFTRARLARLNPFLARLGALLGDGWCNSRRR